MIGLGLDNEQDITLEGLEIIKRSAKIFLESYTSKLNCSIEDLQRLYGKKIILADRDLVEKSAEKIIDPAKESDVSFLVIGDPMGATTHTDIMLRASAAGVAVEVINNASILNAVGVVGLELYKFGRTTSIVFPQDDWKVQAHYDVIKANNAAGLHTLCLLDIKMKEPSKDDLKKELDIFGEPRFMTVNDAIRNLLDIESERKEGVFTEDTVCVGCARIGSSGKKIVAGTAKELLDVDFGDPLHCLIVPGKLHFMEEDALNLWK